MELDIISTENAKNTLLEELVRKLSSSESGISSDEAEKRLQQYGYNEILEKKVSPVVKFLGYFWGPIPWMIEIAAMLSAAIHHWEDFWIIFVLLLLNASVGFWQEHKAENAIEFTEKETGA
jgi:H+-transporting ATPase